MKTTDSYTEAKRLINKLDRIELHATILKILCILFIGACAVLSMYV